MLVDFRTAVLLAVAAIATILSITALTRANIR